MCILSEYNAFMQKFDQNTGPSIYYACARARARGGIYYKVTFSPTHLLAYHAKSKKQKISAAVAIVAQ
jgi:hypothetical protein